MTANVIALQEARRQCVEARRYQRCYQAGRGHYDRLRPNLPLERVIQYLDARINFETGGFHDHFNGQVVA